MIDREQLAEALGRLDPRDREVLDYSLRRHVPDEDLAAVFDCTPSDVARMRAAAVERLADDLAVQRGSDLGHVLTTLLHQSTWDLVPPAEALDPPRADAAPAAEEATPEQSATPAPEPPTPRAAVEPQPEPPAGPETEPSVPTAPVEPPAGPGTEPSVPTAPVEPPAERPESVPPDTSEERPAPVLGMLAQGPADRPEPHPAPPQAAATHDGGSRWSIAAAALIAVLVTIGLGSVLVLGDEVGSSEPADEDSGTRPFVPQRQAIGDPFPSDPDSAYRYPVAVVDRPTTLMDEPRGKPKVRVAAQTEWDSPRVLSVVERQGDWLAVLVPELENGEVGWVHDDAVDRLDTVGWALKVDLSRRVLVVERDGEAVRRMRIGIGRKDHPTPLGRYAVTDKLSVTDSRSPYGCCVVALTGHQTRLPEGWPGGDRLAIHATSDPAGLGEAVSLGCMRTDPDDARWMMEAVPLGTPVFVGE